MSALSEEITNDPKLAGYSGMTDQEVVISLNTLYTNQNKASMAGSELMDNQNSAEFTALTDSKKSQWLALCAIDSVDPFGQVVEVVKDIWGNGSATVSNLAAARLVLVSRATELGLGVVTLGQVTANRGL